MNVLIDSNVLIILLGIAGICIAGAILFVMTLNKRAPEAKLIAFARMKRIPLIIRLYPNNTAQLQLAHKEKGGESGNYFMTKDGSLKFTDASGQNHILFSGNIPLYFYSENLPVSINARNAAHMDYLCRKLAEAGLSVNGIEDIFYQVLSKAFKALDSGQSIEQVIEQILTWVGVRDEATRKKVKLAVEYCLENREELEKVEVFLKPQAFSFQTIVRAIDAAVGWTSTNALQAKSVYEMAALHKAKQGNVNIMIYALGFAIIIGAMAFGAKFMGWV